MKRAVQYRVDAFTGPDARGNPAAVCLLDDWLPAARMQAIARINQLSETAFLVRQAKGYGLRWFTPACEVDLCGHATLASAHVLFTESGLATSCVEFHTRSGALGVERLDRGYAMDFPALPVEPTEPPDELGAALGRSPRGCWRGGDDLLVLLEDQAQVLGIDPDLAVLAALPWRGVIVTAPGADCDFVSRFFAPAAGIAEDPVTGSAHCALTPFWASRLSRSQLSARQLSARGGIVGCRLDGARVVLRGCCETRALEARPDA